MSYKRSFRRGGKRRGYGKSSHITGRKRSKVSKLSYGRRAGYRL